MSVPGAAHIPPGHVHLRRCHIHEIDLIFGAGVLLRDGKAGKFCGAAVDDYPVYRKETIPVPAEGGGTAWSSGGYQVANLPTYQPQQTQ